MAEIRTLCDLYFNLAENQKRPDQLVRKRLGSWEVLSTDEMAKAVHDFSCGLMSIGVKPGDRVVLLSEDRPKWHIADFAILTAGAVNVPPYPTLSAKETLYLINNCEAEVIIVSGENQANKVLSQRQALPNIREIIIMDPPVDIGEMKPWDEVIQWGRTYAEQNPGIHRRMADAVKPDDMATIIYTSGTTGVPKGVMLTHGNFVENCRSGRRRLAIGPTDRALVFLPLSHSFERMIDYCYFWGGMSVAYAESIDKVGDNLGEVKPTLMAAVPRLFEKVYVRLMEQAAHGGFLKKVLIHWSVKNLSSWAEVRGAGKKVGPWLGFKHSVADKLVAKKLRAKVGGRIRFFVSGGAPLSRDLAAFFYGCGLKICEGYGLSETSPVIAVNGEEDVRFGSPGRPLDNVEVKIAEDGEIVVRGPSIMRGYYKMPEATADVLSADGWFATGDIGKIDEEGFLFITDRKKELIVTAGGKKVAPQPIENLLRTNKYVTQAVLIGDKRPYITALLVPNWGNVLKYAKSRGIDKIDTRDLCAEPRIRHLFQNVLDRANADLSRYEQIKRCRLLPRELTAEDGELTPTMKVKRRVINERYAGLIEELYAADENAQQEEGR